MSQVCACGCGGSLAGLRADALYQSEACKKRAQRAASRDKAGTEHPLQLVREEQEASKEKARWTLLAREHLARTLLTTGFVHADDFDALSVPADHRNVIGSQMGSFVAKGLMTEIGRRASANPRRKKAKSAIYEVTSKGKEQLQTLIGSNGTVLQGVGNAGAVGSGERQEIVGVGTEGEQTSSDTLGANSGDPGPPAGVVGTGQLTGKRDQGRPNLSSSPAGVDSPVCSSDDQLVESLCEEFDAQLIDESEPEETGPTTLFESALFESAPSAYSAWEGRAA